MNKVNLFKLFVMGLTYADVELINAGDIELARRFFIGEDEVKRLNINILVGTGAYNLCINESIQAQLNLPFIKKRKCKLANGSIQEYDLVGPVVVKFKNHQTICNALVLKVDNEPQLGKIPLVDLLAPLQKIKPKLLREI
jgi:hypothetical protein